MSEASIKKLIQQFESRTLAIEAWTHEAHLIVAIWYLKNHTKAEATCYLRSGIISYNVAVGTINSPNSGYHESITLFWIHLIDAYIKAHKSLTISELTSEFLDSKYASKTIFFEYYSKDLLFSTEARANWVAPDLKPLS
jgi:hypothetical protein